MCLFRDVLICVGHGFDVAYFNQLKASSCHLHSIYRDFEQGFCLCLGICKESLYGLLGLDDLVFNPSLGGHFLDLSDLV